MLIFVKEQKLVEAQRIEQRTRFDLEMLNEIGFAKALRTTHGICLVQKPASHHRL